MNLPILAGLLLLAVCVTANADPVYLVAGNASQTSLVHTESIHRQESGMMSFTVTTVANRAYLPAGASEPVAIVQTEYVLDCKRNRLTEGATQYVTDEGKYAGHSPEAYRVSSSVESRNNLDAISKKLCW
jgi:hypothetical protein